MSKLFSMINILLLYNVMLSCLSATSHDDELMIFDDDGHMNIHDGFSWWVILLVMKVQVEPFKNILHFLNIHHSFFSNIY